MILDIKTQSNDLTLVNIYGPSEDNPLFYVNLWEKLKTKDTPIIMCGDWNVVQDYDLDIDNLLRQNQPKAQVKISEMMEELGLVDI